MLSWYSITRMQPAFSQALKEVPFWGRCLHCLSICSDRALHAHSSEVLLGCRLSSLRTRSRAVKPTVPTDLSPRCGNSTDPDWSPTASPRREEAVSCTPPDVACGKQHFLIHETSVQRQDTDWVWGSKTKKHVNFFLVHPEFCLPLSSS